MQRPRLFMTWKNRPSREDLARIETWRSHNPGWHVEVHTDGSMDSWMERFTDEQTQEVYRHLVSGACRADLWRYCILREYGGAYVDIDCRCVRPGLLDELSAKKKFVASVDHIRKNCFQAFLVSPREHPVLTGAIVRVIKSYRAGLHSRDVFRFTGPAMMGDIVREITGLRGILGEGEIGGGVYLLRHYGFHNDRITMGDDAVVRCQEPVNGKRMSGGYGAAWTARIQPTPAPESPLILGALEEESNR